MPCGKKAYRMDKRSKVRLSQSTDLTLCNVAVVRSELKGRLPLRKLLNRDLCSIFANFMISKTLYHRAGRMRERNRNSSTP